MDSTAGEEEVKRLRAELKLCINELCLRCGAYKGRHLGACDYCRWKDQDAVICGEAMTGKEEK